MCRSERQLTDGARTRKVNLITVFYFLFLLLIILVYGYTPFPDCEGYLILARDCLLHNDSYPIASQVKQLPFIWNVGAVNAVFFSHKLFGDAGTYALLVLYAAMKAGCAWLVYRIALPLVSEKVAFTAFLLYVVYPANWGEATSILSEIPFTFFSLMAVWLAGRKNGLAGGLCLALANWFRPMAIVFLIPLLFAYRRQALWLLSSYVACIICIGGMNKLRTGYFIYEAKTGWMALRQYSLDHSNSPDNHLYTLADIDKYGSVEKDSVWRTQALRWIKDHPRQYVGQMPAKLIRTFVSDNIYFCAFLPDKSTLPYMYEQLSMPSLARAFPYYNKVQWLTLFNLIYYYLLLAGFLCFVVLAFRKRCYRPLLLLAGTVSLAVTALLLVGHGEARFHNPLMPFIVIGAAVALWHIIGRVKKRG